MNQDTEKDQKTPVTKPTFIEVIKKNPKKAIAAIVVIAGLFSSEEYKPVIDLLLQILTGG